MKISFAIVLLFFIISTASADDMKNLKLNELSKISLENNNSKSKLQLGELYKDNNEKQDNSNLTNNEIKQNYLKIKPWTERSDLQNNTISSSNFDQPFNNNESIKSDEFKMKDWNVKMTIPNNSNLQDAQDETSTQNDINNQLDLKKLYYEAPDIDQDYLNKQDWFKKAAKQEGAKVQLNLAGVRFDDKSANQDFILIQNLNENDTLQNMEQNSANLSEWFEKVGEQGDADAQFIIGLMYEYGIDVNQDYKIAVNWYEQAAMQGDIEAQFVIGVMYEYGNGVNQDYIQALEWFEKASGTLKQAAFQPYYVDDVLSPNRPFLKSLSF